MLADFSIELGRDDPALELPWSSGDGTVRYRDLKAHPDDVRLIPEAMAYPELSAFLVRVNAPGFSLLTAKCDAWGSCEIFPEEEIFQAEYKFVSYVDLVFVAEDVRRSLAGHERFARELCRLLQIVPEIAASTELCIRHCYWHPESESADSDAFGESTSQSGAGFYFSVYVTGFGDSEDEARRTWGIALTLAQNAVVQLACK